MSVETDDDRLAMFEDWGVAATLASGASITGIFDDKYLGLDANGMLVEADSPILFCRSLDVSAQSITHGTVLTINGTAYTVRTVKPDGSGMSQVVLSDG